MKKYIFLLLLILPIQAMSQSKTFVFKRYYGDSLRYDAQRLDSSK